MCDLLVMSALSAGQEHGKMGVDVCRSPSLETTLWLCIHLCSVHLNKKDLVSSGERGHCDPHLLGV